LKHLGMTRPFRGPNGKVLPHSIAEISYLRLGGIEQWVMIRGENVANPPLIILHGGPGIPEMTLFRNFNSTLEKSFTVVYWEQRGSGKSFNRRIPESSMTVERFLADLDELVDTVRRQLRKDQVTILGHSWGSTLGALYASRFPEKVAAYVGSGQVGNSSAGEQITYDFTLAEAERRHNRRALRALRSIGPPPHSGKDALTQRIWLSRFTSIGGGVTPLKFIRTLASGPESSILDLPNMVRGLRFSMQAMWPEVSSIGLAQIVPALQMPAFFFIGRNDHVVPVETSLAYIEKLQAPSKKLVWFEYSGHLPFIEESAKFNNTMIELVRPILGRESRDHEVA